MTNSFVDYYEILGVAPTATSEEIAQRVRVLVKEWHPDVCQNPRAHEMIIQILEAKRVLLDESLRADYDVYRRAAQSGTYRHAGWDQEWETRRERVRTEATKEAELSLEDLLAGIIGIAVVAAAAAVGAAALGTAYAWQGTDRFAGRKPELTFAQRFWCGIGGWACVICLAIPGTSILTFYWFYWAFFPGPTHKFVGCGTVLSSMLLTLLILVPLFGCLLWLLLSE